VRAISFARPLELKWRWEPGGLTVVEAIGFAEKAEQEWNWSAGRSAERGRDVSDKFRRWRER